ncbi:MAG: hypothetical protein E5Y73_29710 [Mesorhizobium sp.]|nr:HAD-IA family hydrolase [Mesorhizobium sp.]TIL85331.1 MAG: hypothetical protein E5Y73_29710 [Mesorhizobium sp.]
MGKPGRAIFEECIARAGTDRLLMVGDQVDTDIKGAKAAGLDALLVISGLNHCGELRQDENGAPDYVAKNLDQIFDGSLFLVSTPSIGEAFQYNRSGLGCLERESRSGQGGSWRQRLNAAARGKWRQSFRLSISAEGL